MKFFTQIVCSEELSSHTLHQRPKFLVQKLKKKKQTKNCQNTEGFANYNIH